MKKENLIIVLIVVFVAGFLAGAVAGIEFYAREHAKEPTGMQAEAAPGAGDTDHGGMLEAAVRNAPQNAQALIALGNFYFDANQYRKAIDTYLRALAVDPNNPDVRTDLGIMYRAVKDYDRAIREFREAARLDPTHKNSRFNLGVVLENDKKDTDGAIAAWEDFLKVEPSGQRAEMAGAEIRQLKAVAK
jgi:tetratricopeptide (TPR) repeat protein